MISATGAASSVNPLDSIFKTQTSTTAISSFAQQLAATLEQYLNSSENGSQIEIDIQPASGADSEGGLVVTVKSPAAPGVASPEVSSQVPDSAAGSDFYNEYVTIPWGTGTTVVPTLSAQLTRLHAQMLQQTPAEILAGEKIAEAGDPMAGTTIQGTNLKWDDLTQYQRIAFIYATDYGLPAGQTMDNYLKSNYGPHIMANAPSSNPLRFGSA
jgi:hypothetical protein